MELVIFLTLLAMALIPAFIAKSKGRSFFLWFIYAAFLSFIALIHALIIKPNENAKGMRKCQSCASVISSDAKICPNCRTEVDGNVNIASNAVQVPQQVTKFNDTRDTSDPTYQLFLVNKYKIEKNQTLDKYVTENKVFPTLDDALKDADNKEQIILDEIEKRERTASIENEQRRQRQEQDRAMFENQNAERLLAAREHEAKMAPIIAARKKWYIAGISIILICAIGLVLFNNMKNNERERQIQIKNEQARIDLTKNLIKKLSSGDLFNSNVYLGNNVAFESATKATLTCAKNNCVQLFSDDATMGKVIYIQLMYCAPGNKPIERYSRLNYDQLRLTNISLEFENSERGVDFDMLVREVSEALKTNTSYFQQEIYFEKGDTLKNTVVKLDRRKIGENGKTYSDVCGN